VSGPASSRGTPPWQRLTGAAGSSTPASVRYRLAIGRYWNAAGVRLPVRSCSPPMYSSITSTSRSASPRCRSAIHEENRANARSHRTERAAEHPLRPSQSCSASMCTASGPVDPTKPAVITASLRELLTEGGSPASPALVMPTSAAGIASPGRHGRHQHTDIGIIQSPRSRRPR
jgi:hypothetical protein